MLVLSRKVGEKILIADNVVITVSAIKGGRVKLGIEAPPEVSILRGELEQTVRDFRGLGNPAAQTLPVDEVRVAS